MMNWFSKFFSCFKAPQSQQQQQVEKTSVKKEDSTASVNDLEASSKTTSGGGAGKSWASLFHKDTPASMTGSTANKPMARIQPYTNVAEDGNETKSDSKRTNKDEGKFSIQIEPFQIERKIRHSFCNVLKLVV